LIALINMNEHKKRHCNAIRKKDVNIECKKIGFNDKYENSTIINKPYIILITI